MSYENRREPRFNVMVAAAFRNGTGSRRAVRVTNLSARGCRFSSPDRRLGAGHFLALDFGRVGLVDARVKWRAGNLHGVRFERPLHPAVLDHIRYFLSEEPALMPEGCPLPA
jgi:hypothetical protein